jgi:hypothetical protein
MTTTLDDAKKIAQLGLENESLKRELAQAYSDMAIQADMITSLCSEIERLKPYAPSMIDE